MTGKLRSQSAALKELGRLHTTVVSGRRTASLARLLCSQIVDGASILDIGCGDGTIASLVVALNPSLKVSGIEVARRPSCSIEYKLFDGIHIPYESGSVDVCMFVDVLHHTADPTPVLREAVRVSRRYVLIKEHLSENDFDWWTLKFMDWMGNRPHGVAMTYNYKARSEWKRIFEDLNLGVVTWNERVRLHTFPLNLFFGRGLHVVTLLEKLPPS